VKKEGGREGDGNEQRHTREERVVDQEDAERKAVSWSAFN